MIEIPNTLKEIELFYKRGFTARKRRYFTNGWREESDFKTDKEGFLIPDDEYISLAASLIAKHCAHENANFRGTISDLKADSDMNLADFIRIGFDLDNVFRGAFLMQHWMHGLTSDYWIEVWADANYPIEIYDDTPEVVENRFRLSDPAIRDCYTLKGVRNFDAGLSHALISNAAAGTGVRVAYPVFPDPVFIHGKGHVSYPLITIIEEGLVPVRTKSFLE